MVDEAGRGAFAVLRFRVVEAQNGLGVPDVDGE